MWIFRRDLVEQVHEASHIPTVASRPQDFVPILIALAQIASVANKEMSLGVPEKSVRRLPLAVQVVEIARVVGLCRQSGPGWGSHKEGIAIPPDRFCGIICCL